MHDTRGPLHRDGLAAQHLDEAFLELLLRRPTARERRWLSHLPPTALRWCLERCSERRLGVARFLSDATSALEAIGPGRAEAEDLWELHDRWRRGQGRRAPRWEPRRPLDPATIDERARAVTALFEDVLGRPPDEATSRRFVARWCLGLDELASLRDELESSEEHARLESFRRRARAALRRAATLASEASEVDALDDLRQLVERWRACARESASTGDEPRDTSHGASSDPLEERALAVDALFRSVLFRPPDARSRRLALARWLLGLDALASLRAELERGREHAEVVRPLVQLARDAIREFEHRAATPSELQACVDRVRTSLRTHAELVAAIADGTARRKLGVRPLKLEMDVTSQCNLRCTMCYFSDPRFGRRERVDVSVDRFREIARQVFPHCGLVSLSFGTEPLLHPRIGELLEITAQEEVPWRYLITNGLLLDERAIEAFVRVPLHGFSVSIDAATPATYERIRRGARWERLMANLRALQDAKRRAGSEYPRVTFNFVLMRSNVDELPALIRLAHELGVEGVSAMHVTPFGGLGMEDELLSAEPERCNAVLAAARAEAERLGVPIALPESFAVEPSGERVLKDAPPAGFLFPAVASATTECPFPWRFVGIDPYGQVLPCGWWYARPPMGDVHEQSFAEIWNGAPWSALRREHATGELRSGCRSCPAAGMGSCDNPRAFATVELGASTQSSKARARPPRNEAPTPPMDAHG